MTDLKRIEQIENADISSLSDEYLVDLFVETNKRADKECYEIGISYNIRDVILVSKIDEKVNALDMAMQTAYDAGVNIEQTLKTIPVWESIINRELMNRGIVPRNSRRARHENIERHRRRIRA